MVTLALASITTPVYADPEIAASITGKKHPPSNHRPGHENHHIHNHRPYYHRTEHGPIVTIYGITTPPREPARTHHCTAFNATFLIDGNNQTIHTRACLRTDGAWHIVNGREQMAASRDVCRPFNGSFNADGSIQPIQAIACQQPDGSWLVLNK